MTHARIQSPNTHTASEGETLWQTVRQDFIAQHGEATYKNWIAPLTLASIDGGEVTLHTPTRFTKEWIRIHFADILLGLFQRYDTHIHNIELRVVASSTRPVEVAKEPADTPENSDAPLDIIGQRLDPRFTFDRFITGPSNELAYAAALKVASSEDVIGGINPLFIYGGVGLGKTHLIQAIAHEMRARQPQKRIVYLSSEKFMYQFVRALREKDIMSFKDMFRSVDVLIIDDVQFICGKTGTQEEFFHTFNALVDSGKQLILSGDRSPSDMDGMEERIRSRLGWGLVADINATTFELRLGILESKAAALSTPVPHDVLVFLAEHITSNIRELEGGLNRVLAYAGLGGRELSVELAKQTLADLLRSNQKVLTVDTIKQVVAEHYNIRMSDMQSARRARSVARPRQIAMYLSKQLTTHSLPEIGRRFGGKDHTTILHAVRKVEQLQTEDAEIAQDIQHLTRSLQQ